MAMSALLVAVALGCGGSATTARPGGPDAGVDRGGGGGASGSAGGGGGAAGADAGGGANDTAAGSGGAGSGGAADTRVDAIAPNPDTAGDRAAVTCVPAPVPKCDAAPPAPGAAQAWRHNGPGGFGGSPRHRGRDLFFAPGAPQWLIAHIGYGLLDTALTDEDVDIYLLRGCGAAWEKLGTARTSDGQHAAVEGIDDNSGRVFFSVPADKTLAVGRHRVRFVVTGDLSAVEAFVEVVPGGTAVVVSDIDGTLTTDENAEFGALLTGQLPDANANAAAALSALVAKGYRPLYLTARAEALVERTREFLRTEGFPAGVIHTTQAGLGANGAAAVTYKTGALTALTGKGLKTSFVIGNSDSDAEAYENAGVRPVDHRIFFQYTDAAFKGRRIEAFSELLPEFAALPLACP